MSSPSYSEPTPDGTQLTQVRVPLERAAEVFSQRDENDRIPIVVIADRGIRVPSSLLLVAACIVILGVFGDIVLRTFVLAPTGVVAALVVLGIVVYSAIRVRVPEGINALLARGGKYVRTLESGIHFLPPWIAVTHLVTRREIPFTVPIHDAPTQDNVRALANILITFTITAPHKFVFNISADDFDLVLHAACQSEIRKMIREITSEQINDLPRRDLSALRGTLSERVAAYGITIMNVSITYAQPPTDFVQSQEARQLAAYQQKEQMERQALAVLRQTDLDALTLQRKLAEEERERDLLLARMKREETKKELVGLEAQVAELRLELLEERLKKYPTAANWERLLKQLAVMRTLAGNSRTILQLGNSDGILRAMLMQDAVVSSTTETGTDIPRAEGTGLKQET